MLPLCFSCIHFIYLVLIKPKIFHEKSAEDQHAESQIKYTVHLYIDYLSQEPGIFIH